MPTIRELVSEAEENYGTGRFANSAQLFKRAGLETLQKGMIDGIYLIYRSLLDMISAKMVTESLQLMSATVYQLTRLIALQSSQALEAETGNPLDLLRLSNNALQQLGQEEEREPVVEMLSELLFQDFLSSRKTERIIEMIKLKEEDDQPLRVFALASQMVKALYKVGDPAFDGDIVAAAMIIQSLSELFTLEEMEVFRENIMKGKPWKSQSYSTDHLIQVVSDISNQSDMVIIDKELLFGLIHDILRDISQGKYNSNTSIDDMVPLFDRYT
ncbi:MAG: hypothetical protein ACXAE3_17335 [Candidatus Kariarchaeaceae archaeon]|jgi:hypothetical protein